MFDNLRYLRIPYIQIHPSLCTLALSIVESESVSLGIGRGSKVDTNTERLHKGDKSGGGSSSISGEDRPVVSTDPIALDRLEGGGGGAP